jgi:hypothetical protein
MSYVVFGIKYIYRAEIRQDGGGNTVQQHMSAVACLSTCQVYLKGKSTLVGAPKLFERSLYVALFG